MTTRNTIQLGENVLRETAKCVEDYSDSYIQGVITDLIDTMRDNDLVGMAAPQIGESLRIFVTEVRETKYRDKQTNPVRVFINPEVVYKSIDMQVGYEGCGSVANAGLFGEVKRSRKIELKYTDESGRLKNEVFEGFIAVIIQHEMDHINGIVFTDISSPDSFVNREYYIKHIRGE